MVVYIMINVQIIFIAMVYQNMTTYINVLFLGYLYIWCVCVCLCICARKERDKKTCKHKAPQTRINHKIKSRIIAAK